jgi:protein arginine N-methyltransferase 2
MTSVCSAFLGCLDACLQHVTQESYKQIRDAGIRSEFLLRVLDQKEAALDSLVIKASDQSALGSNAEFLRSRLRFIKDAHGQEICVTQLDDGTEVGVMMGWEKPISKIKLLASFLTG